MLGVEWEELDGWVRVVVVHARRDWSESTSE